MQHVAVFDRVECVLHVDLDGDDVWVAEVRPQREPGNLCTPRDAHAERLCARALLRSVKTFKHVEQIVPALPARPRPSMIPTSSMNLTVCFVRGDAARSVSSAVHLMLLHPHKLKHRRLLLYPENT